MLVIVIPTPLQLQKSLLHLHPGYGWVQIPVLVPAVEPWCITPLLDASVANICIFQATQLDSSWATLGAERFFVLLLSAGPITCWCLWRLSNSSIHWHRENYLIRRLHRCKHSVLSDGTIHGVFPENRSWMKGTWLQLICCTPSWSHCLKFQSDGDHGGDWGSRRWVHFVDIRTKSYHTWFICINVHGNVCIYEKER